MSDGERFAVIPSLTRRARTVTLRLRPLRRAGQQPRGRGDHQHRADERDRVHPAVPQPDVERQREDDLRQPDDRHLRRRPAAERQRQEDLPDRRRHAHPEQLQHDGRVDDLRDRVRPRADQERRQAHDRGDRREVDDDRPRVDTRERVQPEHCHGGEQGRRQGAVHAAVARLQVRLLDQRDAEHPDQDGGRHPQPRWPAVERPREDRDPQRERVGEGDQVRRRRELGERVEGADHAEAAGEAADPQPPRPEHELRPGDPGHDTGDDRHQPGPEDRHRLPVAPAADLCQVVGQLDHQGEREAAAEHPDVGAAAGVGHTGTIATAGPRE